MPYGQLKRYGKRIRLPKIKKGWVVSEWFAKDYAKDIRKMMRQKK